MRYRSDYQTGALAGTFLWFFTLMLQVVFLGLHFGFGFPASLGVTFLPAIVGASVFALIVLVGFIALMVAK